MKCHFVVGQKVPFIGDFSDKENEEWAVVFGIEFPKNGSVYTIRDIVVRACGSEDEAVGLLLEEVLNLPNPLHRDEDGGEKPLHECSDGEIAWCHTEFRPLDVKTADIAIFKAMLNPARTEVKA